MKMNKTQDIDNLPYRVHLRLLSMFVCLLVLIFKMKHGTIFLMLHQVYSEGALQEQI